jgi:dynein light chain roadblock-type
VEETLNRIKTHKTVQGILIVNSEANIVRSSYQADKKEEGEALARSVHQLAQKARSIVRDLDPSNDLTFLRIKTKQNEIMVAPDKDFMLIVVQGPKDSKNE